MHEESDKFAFVVGQCSHPTTKRKPSVLEATSSLKTICVIKNPRTTLPSLSRYWGSPRLSKSLNPLITQIYNFHETKVLNGKKMGMHTINYWKFTKWVECEWQMYVLVSSPNTSPLLQEKKGWRNFLRIH